jgi:serine protease Do
MPVETFPLARLIKEVGSMEQRFRFRPRSRAAFIAAAFLLVVIGGGFALHDAVWAADSTGRQTATTVKHANISSIPAGSTAALASLENGFAAIAARLEPSVVSIKVEKTMRTTSFMPDMGNLFRDFGFPGFPDMQPPQGQPMPPTLRAQGEGSGVIVRSDGWILTNDHVVGGADKVVVKLNDGRELPGTVRRDYRSDLALVKINASNLETAELGDSDHVRVGQWAIAFGSPFELSDTMTVGIVSALHRQTTISEGGEARYYPSLIQTDAAINPGNSGGPLVDILGRVIGINVAINSPNGGNVGIGFAIPANTARYVMDQLITKGKVTRGFLGFVPAALTPVQRQRYGVPSGGALVTEVQDGTPASRAGLQVEDVIVRYDGKPVRDDVALRDMVARTAPGRSVEIVVRRNGHERTLTATPESAPNEVAMQGQPEEAQGGKLGLRVEPVTPDNARRFNLGRATNGVVIVEIQSGSPADQAGLQPGDVILRANERPIHSGADLRSAVQSTKSGDTVRLILQRGNARELVSVQMP